MAMIFFPGELVLVSDGYNFEYANVETVAGNIAASVLLRNNSQIQEKKDIIHVVVNSLTLDDIGYQYLPDAMLDRYNGPCYHRSLNNDYNAKIVSCDGKWQIAKESTPGALDKFVPVETIGDIQMKLKMWFNAEYDIDANKIGTSAPKMLHDNVRLDKAIELFLNGDDQKKYATFQALTDYLQTSVYNLDICHYWLAEYHYWMYKRSGDKVNLRNAVSHLEKALKICNKEHFRERLAEIKIQLSK